MKQNDLKRFLVPLGVITLMVIILNILVDNPYTHRLVSALINNQMQDRTDLNLKFEVLNLSIVPLGFELYGAQLTPSENIDEAPIAKASRIQANLSIWSLMIGRPKLGLVAATDLELLWTPLTRSLFTSKEDQGSTDSTTGIKWPPSFEPPIEQLKLENTRLYAEIPLDAAEDGKTSSLFIVSSGLDLNIEVSDWNDIQIDLNTKSFDLARDGNYLLEDAKIDFGGEVVSDRITIPYLKIKGERIDLSGSLHTQLHLTQIDQLIHSMEITSDIRSEMDLSILGSWLDLGNTFGKTKASIQLKAFIPLIGDLESSFSATGQGHVQDGYLSGFRLFDSQTSFQIDGERIRFSDLKLRIGDDEYGVAEGFVGFGDGTPFDFDIRPEGLHLYDLLNALGVDFDTIDFELKSPHLKLKGVGEPFAMEITSIAELANLRIPALDKVTQDYRPPTCHMKIDLRINSKELKFTETGGFCFDPTEYQEPLETQPSMFSVPANTSDLTIGGDLSFGKEGPNLLIQSKSFDLKIASYFAMIPLDGTASIATKIYGSYDSIVVENQWLSQNSVVANFPLGNIKALIKVFGSHLTWQNLEARLDEDSFIESKKGKLEYKDLIVQLEMIAKNIPPKAMQNLFPSNDPKKNLGFEVVDLDIPHLNGPLLYPGRLEGRGKLLLSQLNLGEQHLLDHIDINFQGTENGWRLENGKFRLKDLEGGFHFEQFHAQSKLQSLPEGRPVGFPMNIGFSERDNYKLALHISPNKNTKTPIAQESDLAILPFVGPYLSQAQLAGRLELQANFEGQLGQFQGSVEGQVKNLSLLNTDISPLNFRGFLNHSFVDLTFDQSGQALRGRISFDLNEEDIPYEWYISMHQFDIRPFGFGYFSRDPRNFAYLSADWKLKGNFMNWWQSRGDFNLNELIVKYNHQTELTSESVYIKNHNPVKLVMTPERWYLDNNEPLTILGDDLVFKLSLGDSRLPERLSLDIESVVRFGLLKKLFDQVETASGAAMANLSLKGPISNLRSTMAIKSLPPDAPLSDGHALSIGISNIRPAFQNIDFAINYSDGLLLVKRFQSEKGQGNITASGQVEWGQKSSGRTNLVIDLNNTNFITPVPLVKSLDSNLTGTINVSGASFPYLISGDVAIVKSRSTRDFDLTAELMKELRKTSFHLDSADRKQYFNFNLNVKADESVIIRNRNINIVLSSDLVIKGSENKPEILGQVEVNRGKFVYKRDFEIQRGLITFDDPIKLDPAIDIIASADVSPYRVTIIASGRASKPVVDMTVDPPTKEDGTPITPIETIVLISRGRLPTNTFSFEERDAVGAEALNLFVGQFEQPVEKLFDLTGQDIIQEVYLDTYPSEVDGSPTLRLNFPINIIGGLDLTLRSDPDTLRLSAEYPIHDSISAYVDFIKPNTAEEDQKKDASNTAFDLKFRFAFP